MENAFYRKFCKEGFDENGVLNFFEPICPADFNFAYDVVDQIAEEEPERRALVWCNEEGEERVFTFGDIKKYSNQAANLFLSCGIKHGDRVMLVLKRHYQFWFAILGLHKIGAITIPATHLLTAKDFVYRFEAAEVSALVCTGEGEVSQHVEEAEKQYSGLNCKMIARGERAGWISFDKELEKMPKTLERIENKASDTLLLYFTSGTTGYPKMVCHDHSYPLGHIITAKYWHNIKPDGLHLTVSETGWAKSVWGKLYGQWLLAAGIFVYDFEKFIPTDLLSMLEKYKITTFCAPPTIYRFLIKEDMKAYDLSHLQYATTAGEALNPEVSNQFYQFTGLKPMEAFGQTETTVLTGNFVGMPSRPGSLGKASPLYDVDLVDENGHSLAPGEVGEIVVRTDKGRPIGMFFGYYEGAEKTKEVWYQNIYHTGDTAWKDEHGIFWYVGRTDDVIKASGYRIGPFEIESVLMEHPSVLECAVTGAPDPIRGTVVKATIVLAKGYAPSEALIKELQNYVKKQTAPYKYPRIIEFVTELPKTISGKIRRVEIRMSAQKKNTPESQ